MLQSQSPPAREYGAGEDAASPASPERHSESHQPEVEAGAEVGGDEQLVEQPPLKGIMPILHSSKCCRVLTLLSRPTRMINNSSELIAPIRSNYLAATFFTFTQLWSAYLKIEESILELSASLSRHLDLPSD